MSITRKQNFPITGMLHSTIHVLGTPNIYAANILFKIYICIFNKFFFLKTNLSIMLFHSHTTLFF